MHLLLLPRRWLGAEMMPVASDIIRQHIRIALILLGHKFKDDLALSFAARVRAIGFRHPVMLRPGPGKVQRFGEL